MDNTPGTEAVSVAHFIHGVSELRALLMAYF